MSNEEVAAKLCPTCAYRHPDEWFRCHYCLTHNGVAYAWDTSEITYPVTVVCTEEMSDG